MTIYIGYVLNVVRIKSNCLLRKKILKSATLLKNTVKCINYNIIIKRIWCFISNSRVSFLKPNHIITPENGGQKPAVQSRTRRLIMSYSYIVLATLTRGPKSVQLGSRTTANASSSLSTWWLTLFQLNRNECCAPAYVLSVSYMHSFCYLVCWFNVSFRAKFTVEPPNKGTINKSNSEYRPSWNWLKGDIEPRRGRKELGR